MQYFNLRFITVKYSIKFDFLIDFISFINSFNLDYYTIYFNYNMVLTIIMANFY